MTDRYRHTDLIACATDLFGKAGLDPAIAAAVAEILVDADLLGYDTHGLQFVPTYLAALERGKTTTAGEPAVVRDQAGALLLDGRGLPGQWVLLRALALARERLADHALVAATVYNVGNIACLATYVKRAAEAGLLALLAASAPTSAAVTPHGGRAAAYSTNPLALGVPTEGHPILIDSSASASSNRQVERHRRAGTPLPRRALVAADGTPTDDPEALSGDPPGAILPGGGVDYGHKGFALGLLVEAFTSGLAGTGRADAAAGNGPGGNTATLLLVQPAAFGGLDALRHEMAHLAAACRATPPADPAVPVRVPGDRAYALYERQLAEGVALHPEILPRIVPLLERYGVPAPQPIA